MCLEQTYFLWTSANYISGTMASSGYTAPSDTAADAAPVLFVDADDASTVAIAPQDINPYFCFEIQVLNPIT